MFGVTGDLAGKKLLPAIYDLANRGLLPPAFSLVGFARRDWSQADFKTVVHDSVKAHARTPWSEEVWRQLAKGIRFVSGRHDDPEAFLHLKQTVDELDKERGTAGNHTFYLSIPPRDFPLVSSSYRRQVLRKQSMGNLDELLSKSRSGQTLKLLLS